MAETGDLPLRFGPDHNVVWKTELALGHSSPVLTEDRIFLTATRDGKLLTLALNPERWEDPVGEGSPA